LQGAQQSYTLADVRQRAEAGGAGNNNKSSNEADETRDAAIQGVRLGLPAGNSSRQVVEANIESMSREKLVEHLVQLGVPPAAEVSDADLAAMLKLAVRSDFWRGVWQQHPNKGLLRMWMYAHDGFRKRLTALRQTVAGDADLTAAQVADVDSHLQGFLKKNAPHSEFEDTQLFPYFKEAYPQFAQFWQEIDNQHGKFNEVVKKATEAIAAGASGGANGDARKSLAGAVNGLADFYEDHLLLEERLMVPLWLNVTDAQKAELRSRLRGMYWLSSYSF
uniref:Hemerythrin domain-containing protein n=3 Tax=Macrostomum lignano TaxID=282301 RepID=A0A1I8HXK9_9PLAT